MTMAIVERVIGGAGTGKTRFILDRMCEIQKKFRLEPEQIGFSTFTRMARREMTVRAAGRWGVSEKFLNRDGYFRTCHSLCLRQLKVVPDQLLVDDTKSREWIANRVGIELKVRLDEGGNPFFEPMGKNDSEGAAALMAWQLARRTLTPMREWIRVRQEQGEPVVSWDAVNDVVQRYETAKRVLDRLDFDDILAQFAGLSFTVEGIRDVHPRGELPDGVEAWFLDECQDSTALMNRVFQRLAAGANVRYCLLAADPYQALYSYAGASADHFLAWPGQESIMPRSYRCPQVVMALGERCLQQMHRGYQDRGIAPAPHAGQVVQAGSSEEAIGEHVVADQPCLILARCSYSLASYADRLREARIPFTDLQGGPSAIIAGFRAIWDLGHGEPVYGQDWKEAILM
ncbi:MAG: UvrD-helicase domain-containing protein, partial [Planctomycetia bacterium]